ncbi:MAG: diguanylate cyclase, partial [bacterium]
EKPFTNYTVEAMRVKDHMLVRITDDEKAVETIVALPDSARFAYISITGEHCMITNIHVDREEVPVPANTIPRIAEEISYVRGCPEGDVPNVQVDGWRYASTEGMKLVGDDMKLTFHSQSLPTARLVWHCPYVSLYTSKDGKVNGEGYREFLLLRLDGEGWDSDSHAENDTRIDHTHQFPGWNAWKEANKQGLDWEVMIHRNGNSIRIETETLGISIVNLTTIKDEVQNLYIALTGDQCALTDIHAIPISGHGREA